MPVEPAASEAAATASASAAPAAVAPYMGPMMIGGYVIKSRHSDIPLSPHLPYVLPENEVIAVRNSRSITIDSEIEN